MANGKSNNVSILLGNGDGTFQAPLNTAVGTEPIALAAADFNGDGKLDLAVADFGVPGLSAGSFAVLIGNGNGTFQPQQDPLTNPGAPVAVVAADFNGDGKVDLAVANEDTSTITLLAGNGNGAFQPPVTFAINNPIAMIAADFDQNGTLDLAVPTGENTDLAAANFNLNTVSVLLNTSHSALR